MKYLILLLTFILQTNITYASGSTIGNGTDYVRFEDRGAWFATKGRKISYCIEIANDFGVSQSVAESTIAEAFESWRSYAQKRGFKLITFDSVLQPTCSDTTDLKFYLGVQNTPEVQKYSEHFNNRLAAAIRTSFDINQVWSQGFIFITSQGTLSSSELDSEERNTNRVFPNWQAPLTFKAVLLHELGHVFGTEHTPETIMDANLSHSILNHKTHTLELSGIDGRRFLLNSKDPISGSLGLSYTPAKNNYPACRDEAPFNFELLTSRKSQGKVHAKFEFKAESAYVINAVLIINDDLGSFPIPIEFFAADPVLAGERSLVFNLVRLVNGGPQMTSGLHTSQARHFKLATVKGEIIFGQYLHNLTSAFQRGPTSMSLTGEVLTYMTATGSKILFHSSPVKENGWSSHPQQGEPENCTSP